ncbi:MAG: hypothetical protein SF053_10305 [Bacteroidia bacterium]|jgi:hypothetical protein|nr:hypothetical protein [Bacteroidia bacterium]
MKHLSIFTVGLLLSGQIHGQNSLFVPFGLSKHDVISFLNTRDYIRKIEEDADMQSLRAELDENKRVEYVFTEQGLYATTVTRSYEQRRTAREVEKSVMAYMNTVSQGQVQQSHTEEGIVCYTAMADSRVLKLFIQTHEESVTLTLTAMSRNMGPIADLKDFYYEADLLQRRFISN